jgi:hypothetical protein
LYTFYVPGVATDPIVNGLNLVSVASLPSPLPINIYAVKNAPRPTFRDTLLNAAIVPADQKTFLHVWVYCPDLKKLPDERPKDRILRFGKAVEAAERLRPDVFIGPEYFFARASHRIDSNVDNHAYSAEEKQDVEKVVRGLGYNNKGMLIIPGTVFWKDANNLVRNTAIIHCRNEGLYLEHNKCNAHLDADFAATASGTWQPGTVASDFTFRTFKCRFQICADNGADGEQIKDVHLVSAYGLGNVVSKAHQGGWFVLSDGIGIGRVEPTSRDLRVAVPATNPGGDQFSLAVDIRKLA